MSATFWKYFVYLSYVLFNNVYLSQRLVSDTCLFAISCFSFFLSNRLVSMFFWHFFLSGLCQNQQVPCTPSITQISKQACLEGIYCSVQMCLPYSICFVFSFYLIVFFFPKCLQRGSKDLSGKQKVLDLLRPEDLFSDLCLKENNKPPHPRIWKLPKQTQKFNWVHQL